MGEPMVNGEKPSSQFISVSHSTELQSTIIPTLQTCLSFTLLFHREPHLIHILPQHLTSYPLVSDTLETYKTNPYGQKSLQLATNSYAKYLSPLVPYLRTPYSFISPYVVKADELGDAGLERVDARFPIVKEDTLKLKDRVVNVAFFPVTKAGEGKDYVLSTYGSEYKKCGGDGYVAGGKAVVTTGLVVTSDVITWVGGFLKAGKGRAEAGKDGAKDHLQTAKGQAKETYADAIKN